MNPTSEPSTPGREQTAAAALVAAGGVDTPATPFKAPAVVNSERNSAFIRAFKKQAGPQVQAKLPTPVSAQNDWAIKNGWSTIDAQEWRALCTRFAHGTESGEGSAIDLMMETLDLANHVDCHPIGLIHFARTKMGRGTWNNDTVEFLKANMLADDAEPADEDYNPSSDEAYDIDDDKVASTSTGKKRKSQ